MFEISGFLIIIAQVITGVHAYRRGNYLWLLLIIFIPLLGVLIYFFAEMLPSLRSGRSFQGAGTQVANTLQPTRRLKQLEEQLEEQDTLAVRQAYAEELLRFERTDEAIAVLEGGLKGVFASDPQGMQALAKAYLQKGDYEKALTLLNDLRDESPGFEPDRVRLLRARALEQLGELDEALNEYRELSQRGYSEEPRYRLALALDKAGFEDEAEAVYAEAQKYFERSSGIYRRENAPWNKQLRQYFNAKSKA